MPWQDRSVLGPKLWSLLPIAILLCALGLAYTGMSVKASSLIQPYAIVAGLGAMLAFYATRRPDPVICGMLEALLFLLAISPPLALLDYPLQSLAFPLRDAEFAAADAVLGFDWTGHLTWLSKSPVASMFLVIAYRSCMVQFAAMIMLLSVYQRFDHLRELLALFILTCLFVFLCSSLWPAEGAYVFHAPADSVRLLGSKTIGIMHVASVQALRTGALHTIDMATVEGLVSLPSFHVIFAILLAWSTRSYRWLFAPAVIWNAIVCVSAIAVGGHYLVDVIAGAAIAFAAIYAYQTGPVAALLKWDLPSRLRQAPALQ